MGMKMTLKQTLKHIPLRRSEKSLFNHISSPSCHFVCELYLNVNWENCILCFIYLRIFTHIVLYCSGDERRSHTQNVEAESFPRSIKKEIKLFVEQIFSNSRSLLSCFDATIFLHPTWNRHWRHDNFLMTHFHHSQLLLLLALSLSLCWNDNNSR